MKIRGMADGRRLPAIQKSGQKWLEKFVSNSASRPRAANKYMRISIIGLAGSGKSTLAERISKKFNIPHLHIDRLWFEAGGPQPPHDESSKEKIRAIVRDRVGELVKNESWVCDGWQSIHPDLPKRADQIVFLDISLARRLLNLVYRMLFVRRHAEVSFWEDIKFLLEVIRRTYRQGPPLSEFVREYAGKVLVLHNYREVERYFSGLG